MIEDGYCATVPAFGGYYDTIALLHCPGMCYRGDGARHSRAPPLSRRQARESMFDRSPAWGQAGECGVSIPCEDVLLSSLQCLLQQAQWQKNQDAQRGQDKGVGDRRGEFEQRGPQNLL